MFEITHFHLRAQIRNQALWFSIFFRNFLVDSIHCFKFINVCKFFDKHSFLYLTNNNDLTPPQSIFIMYETSFLNMYI